MERRAQSIREALELHRGRLLSRAQLEPRLEAALAQLGGDRRAKLAARSELAALLPHAPYNLALLRALFAFEKRPYSEQAERYGMALADATGEVPGHGWSDQQRPRLQRLADGTYETCTDCDLIFEGIAPCVGRHNVELRWAEHDHAAVLAVYERSFPQAGEWERSDAEHVRSPWRLEERFIAAPHFRRSSLLRLFEDLAPLVEDVRFFCYTQSVRYEIWIVAGELYVLDHPDDIDARPGDVIAPVLQKIPGDEALRTFVTRHRRSEARRELQDLAERRSHASVDAVRAAIELCRAIGDDVSDLVTELEKLGT
jgi:hypothetical protein